MKNTKMKQQPTFSDSCVDFCRLRTWRGEGGGGGTTPQRWFGSPHLFYIWKCQSASFLRQAGELLFQNYGLVVVRKETLMHTAIHLGRHHHGVGLMMTMETIKK